MKVSVSLPRSTRLGVAALAIGYLLAHVPFLPPSLEDIDSINFALGLRHFDPALHQPHPPGYPVYIAAGRLSLAVISRLAPTLPPARSEALALAIWSLLAGALAIIAAARLFHAVESRRASTDAATTARVAIWGAALLAVAPLFWMSGLRPMSDMPGLAAVLWAQTLLLEGARGGRRLALGAVLAGLAAGIRIQTLPLTLPILLLAMIERRTLRPIAWLAGGIVAWAVPLVIATGGVAAYRRALGTQAAEDFGWVDMLWSNPTPRRLAFSVYETFVLPWASTPLAVVIAIAALAGLLVACFRARGPLAVMLLAFAPYLPYHLLFQETITVRYALPVLPLVAWLAVRGLLLARRAFPAVAVPVVGAAAIVAIAGGVAYASAAHPAFRAIDAANRRAETAPPAATYSHYSVRRPLQVAATPTLHVVEPRRSYEWLGLADYWRDGGSMPVWFLADAKRTDLALIDPESRRDVVRYDWPAGARAELSGTRPIAVDWYRLSPPGWFAGEGWSLTPEVGGITRATDAGPDRQPIVAWVRRRSAPMHLVVGGRHLGDPGEPDAECELAIDGVLIDRWRLSVGERNFLRFVELPQGLPAGATAYARLTITARAASATGRAEVAIRQFDVQPASRLVYGFGEGWHEEEYAVETGLRWRWTSERSVLRLKGPPQAVRLTLRGESPLKYVDRVPTVTVAAGDRIVGTFKPAADFEWSVVIPAEAWQASAGAVAIATDRIYLPGPAEGTNDTRHLGLRLYDVQVNGIQP